MGSYFEDVSRRVYNGESRGTVVTVESVAHGQFADVKVGVGETLEDVERLENYGFTSFPNDGSEAFIVFVGGSRDDGVLIAADQPEHEKKVKLEKGEVAVWTSFGSSIHLKKDGSVLITADKIQTKGKTLSVKNEADDLIKLLSDLVKALTEVKVNTALGPQVFLNLAAFTKLQASIDAFVDKG